MNKPRFSRKRWGIDWEISKDSVIYRSCKGQLTVKKADGGVVVFGEVRLGRWDGREPTTDQEFDWNVFRSADEPHERYSEITSGQIRKTFSGRGAYSEAKAWAGEQLIVVPVTVPFDVAMAWTTGEGVRDWDKLLGVLAQELKFKKIERALDTAAFETMATSVLSWDRKSPLPNEDYLRSLYDKRVLRSSQ